MGLVFSFSFCLNLDFDFSFGLFLVLYNLLTKAQKSHIILSLIHIHMMSLLWLKEEVHQKGENFMD